MVNPGPSANIEYSRWRRPRLYHSIVMFYLLVVTGVGIAIAAGTEYSVYQTTSEDPNAFRSNMAGFALIAARLLEIGASAFSAIMLVGAVALLTGRERGVHLASISLGILVVILFLFAYLSIGGAQDDGTVRLVTTTTIWGSLVASSFVMIWLLIIGSRRIRFDRLNNGRFE